MDGSLDCEGKLDKSSVSLGEGAESDPTQKGSNLKPSSGEATVLTSAPPCHPGRVVLVEHTCLGVVVVDVRVMVGYAQTNEPADKQVSPPHLAHAMFPVDLGGAVGLQFDVGGGTGRLVRLRCVFRLMIGSLDPVASELRQQDEGERAGATQNLNHEGQWERWEGKPIVSTALLSLLQNTHSNIYKACTSWTLG